MVEKGNSSVPRGNIGLLLYISEKGGRGTLSSIMVLYCLPALVTEIHIL